MYSKLDLLQYKPGQLIEKLKGILLARTQFGGFLTK